MFNKSVAFALLVAAGALLSPETPDACGPDFPTNMLVRRAEALSEMWSGSFMDEAALLVPASDLERMVYTRKGLPLPAPPEEQAIYDAAAESFHAGDLTKAERGFATFLKLPIARRLHLSLAAAYSLGRAHALDGHRTPAIAAFRQVRALAKAGLDDRDQLATASYGEEAAVVHSLGSDIVGAVHLYAQQASLDESGRLSLLFVLRELDADERVRLARDDVGARLLQLYFYTRGDELDEEQHLTWSRELARSSTTEARGADYAAAAAYRSGDWKRAAQLAAVCHHAPIATWVQAKLALRDGDRKRAQALLAQVEQSRLGVQFAPATKVRGELGLLALADEHFTQAVQWFAKGQRVVEASYVAERVLTIDEMQQAVLATAEQRREPLYVDETDEGPLPIYMSYGSDDPDRGPDYLPNCDAWTLAGDAPPPCWPHRLHAMYARRLIREHRYDDALAAFGSSATDVEEPQKTSNLVQFADDAGQFINAARAAAAASGVERSEQLFAAAKVMRDSGMEIAGTETAPDWRIYDGSFSRSLLCLPSATGGYETYADEPAEYDGDEGVECVPPSRADATYVSPAEVARERASAPPGEQRFAYRIVASLLAEQAAELVPPRSQAYGALMCWAAKYASRDQERFEAIYSKFLRNGASGVGGAFGSECPDPEFGRARTFDDDQAQRRVDTAVAAQQYEQQRHTWTVDRVKRAAWRRKRYAGIPLAVVLTFLTLYVARRARRHRVTLGSWGSGSH